MRLSQLLLVLGVIGVSGLLGVACSSSESDGDSAGCSSDQECKGERICVDGACVSPGEEGASGSDGGVAGTNGGSAGGTSSTEPTTSCQADPGLEQACIGLCDAFKTSGCTLMDLSVRDVYRLYVNDGDDDCVDECVAGDLRQDSLPDAPTKCGSALRAYVERAAQNTCINVDPAKNFYGQWDWEGLEAEANALTACGQECLNLPTCSPSTCNGSMSAGDVFCSWACNGRVCEQSCN